MFYLDANGVTINVRAVAQEIQDILETFFTLHMTITLLTKSVGQTDWDRCNYFSYGYVEAI